MPSAAGDISPPAMRSRNVFSPKVSRSACEYSAELQVQNSNLIQ